MIARAIIVWLLIAAAEVIHGILRVRLLNRRVGDHRARQIAVGTGSGLILFIAWFTVPWICPDSAPAALAVGGLWLGLMLAFEILFGRLVFRVAWDRIAADFDLRRGGLLGFGMLILLLAPLMVGNLRNMF